MSDNKKATLKVAFFVAYPDYSMSKIYTFLS